MVTTAIHTSFTGDGDVDVDGDGDGDGDGASLKWKLHSGGPIVSNCYAMLC